MNLSKPHIDCDNSLHAWNTGIYVGMYHLPRICCTLVPEIRVHPEMLSALQYIDVFHMCDE